jgi:hypothetical protein
MLDAPEVGEGPRRELVGGEGAIFYLREGILRARGEDVDWQESRGQRERMTNARLQDSLNCSLSDEAR